MLTGILVNMVVMMISWSTLFYEISKHIKTHEYMRSLTDFDDLFIEFRCLLLHSLDSFKNIIIWTDDFLVFVAHKLVFFLYYLICGRYSCKRLFCKWLIKDKAHRVPRYPYSLFRVACL